MDYEISYFNYRQREQFGKFLENFTAGNYRTPDLIGDRFWHPVNYLGGIALLLHTKTEIVSQLFLTGRRLFVDGQIVEFYERGSAYTLPDHQRRGL